MNKGSVAPSSYNHDGYKLNAYYKNRTGLLSDVKDLYADFIYRKNDAHSLGVKLYSEQETSLFRKSKFQAVYAYTIPIYKKLFISLGTQFGLANIFFGSSGASAGGSGFAFDASLSSTFHYKTLDLGIALHQIPNTSITPLSYPFVLERYTDTYLSNKFKLNSKYELESGFNTKINQQTFLWSIDNRLALERIGGINLRYGKENAFSTGIYFDIPVDANTVTISASYSNFFRQEDIKYHSFSIGLFCAQKQ